MTRQDFIAAAAGDLSETPLLYYVGGYKYQSRNDMIYQTFIYPDQDIVTDLIILRRDGWMWVGKYFAWDGCSGPTWDDSTNMCAGQAHDALYALMRMGLLPMTFRPASDSVLHRLMVRDGAWDFRADYYQWGVNNFAGRHADPKTAKVVKIAPRRIKMPGLAPA
jgi:hypothetical protein